MPLTSPNTGKPLNLIRWNNASALRWGVYLAGAVLLGLLWEWLAAQNITFRLLLSSPKHVVIYLTANGRMMSSATFTTLLESLLGLASALTLCSILGVVFVLRPPVLKWLLPLLYLSQVVPIITIAPLAIILLGSGLSSKVVMVLLVCFFPLLISFITAITLVPKQYVDLLLVYGTSRPKQLRHLYLPLALPHIMSGLRVTATLSVIGAVVAEFSGAEAGLGKNLFLACKRLEPDLMLSSLACTFGTSALLLGTIVLLERRIKWWKYEIKNAAS